MSRDSVMYTYSVLHQFSLLIINPFDLFVCLFVINYTENGKFLKIVVFKIKCVIEIRFDTITQCYTACKSLYTRVVIVIFEKDGWMR